MNTNPQVPPTPLTIANGMIDQQIMNHIRRHQDFSIVMGADDRDAAYCTHPEIAARIHACVNGCAGLARPELIPSVLDNLRMLLEWSLTRAKTSDDATMIDHVALMLTRLEGGA